jgi:hypothetical protein
MLDLLHRRRVFSRSHENALDATAGLKTVARFGVSDGSYDNAELFGWQYVQQMLGRYDHDFFADRSDFEARLDFEADQVMPNMLSCWRADFDAEYDALIEQEGRRFGVICGGNCQAAGGVHRNTEAVMTRMPTGSISNNAIPDTALAELDRAYINKKLGVAYMTVQQEEALKREEVHSRSKSLEKLELAKMRNLAPGSTGYYLTSATISAYGESRFLATLADCPLMWGEDRRAKFIGLQAQYQNIGYVANRDFKNYNICHTHARMRAFYLAAAQGASAMGSADMVAEFERAAQCLESVGVYDSEGVYHRWEYGLMSGWGHTMLFNCLFNSCSGRAAAKVVANKLGVSRILAVHQGDDSAEVWDSMLGGPVAQALLDAAGQPGQSSKQHFARGVGEWSEFLRIWYQHGQQRGSALRSLCSFVSNDAQHAPTEGGFGQIKAIVNGFNTFWRRSGGRTAFREADVRALLAYWQDSNLSNRDVSVEKGRWEAALAPGDGLTVLAFPGLFFDVEGREHVRRARYPVAAGDILRKRARRNLLAVAVRGAEHYAEEYVDDLMQSAVEQSDVVTCAHVGARAPVTLTSAESVIADEVVRRYKRGLRAWRSEDQKCKEMVVGQLFAGSERVAESFVADKRPVVKEYRMSVLNRINRGLKVLAGITSDLKTVRARYYACSDHYWGHIESVLRDWSISKVSHAALGHAISRRAVLLGEWI